MCLSLTDWMLQWRQLLRDAADCTAVWMEIESSIVVITVVVM